MTPSYYWTCKNEHIATKYVIKQHYIPGYRLNITNTLHTCGKPLHDLAIFLRLEVWGHQTSLVPPLFLTCLYQVRKVSSHVLVCYRYKFGLFLRFEYLILELFRRCGIFGFSFYYLYIYSTFSLLPVYIQHLRFITCIYTAPSTQ